MAEKFKLKNYKAVSVNQKPIGNLDRRTIQIKRNDNKPMKSDEMQQYYKKFKQELDKDGKDYKLGVIAMTDTGLYTFANISQTPQNTLNILDHEEYMRGRIADPKHDGNFHYMQIIVIYDQ